MPLIATMPVGVTHDVDGQAARAVYRPSFGLAAPRARCRRAEAIKENGHGL